MKIFTIYHDLNYGILIIPFNTRIIKDVEMTCLEFLVLEIIGNMQLHFVKLILILLQIGVLLFISILHVYFHRLHVRYLCKCYRSVVVSMMKTPI